jgi:alkaline phosphatase D
LWTRLSVHDSESSASGQWEVFDSLQALTAVAHGEYQTDSNRDFTVKVEARGLEPGTTYYYRFVYQGHASPTGRTRTAPAGPTERLRFAVFSCASLAYGYFHAYRAVAGRADVDAVLHLGDYIYEHGNDEYGSVRGYQPPHQLLTLSDYRLRYAQYRSDSDLQQLHQQFPFAAVWDDHEVANDAYAEGAPDHDPSLGLYAERKQAAQQAYFEWLPVREAEPGRLHRSLSFGDLAHVVLADTRHWGRDEPITNVNDPAFEDPARSILGLDQEAWLEGELVQSNARWRLLAQQVMFSTLNVGITNTDAWDGYPKSRERLLTLIRERELDNLVILTGDIHMSFAIDVVRSDRVAEYDPDTGEGAVCVEFVTPSVTSASLDREVAERLAEVAIELPEVRLAQLWRRGYMLLDIDHDRLQAEWYLFDRVDGPSEQEFFAAWQLRTSERFLRPASDKAPEKSDPPPLAPVLTGNAAEPE